MCSPVTGQEPSRQCSAGVVQPAASIGSKPFSTAGQEDPFELDSNLRLSAGQQDEVRKRQCGRLLCLLMQQMTACPWDTSTC